MTYTLDHSLFLLINAPLGLTGLPLALAVFAAKDLIYVALLIMVGLWLWGGKVQKQMLLLAVIASILGLIVSALIGHVWFQARPFAQGLGNTYLQHVPDSSFPSDHVTFLAAISFMLLWHRGTRLVGFILFLITLIVAWARVFVGIHFPVDMFGALALGFLSALIVISCHKLINRKLFPLIERAYVKLFAKPISWGWVKS